MLIPTGSPPAVACRFAAASPCTQPRFPSARPPITRHQRGFKPFARPIFPQPVAARMERAALGLNPRASHPADQEPDNARRDGDRPSSTDLELPLNSHPSISNPIVHSMRATSRRTATSGSRGRLTSDESFAAIGIVRGRGRLRGPRRRPRPAGLQWRRLRRFARRSRASNAAPLGYSPADDGPSGPVRRRVDDLRVTRTRTSITNFLEKPRSRRRLVCPQARSRNHARPPVRSAATQPAPRPRRGGSNSRRGSQQRVGRRRSGAAAPLGISAPVGSSRPGPARATGRPQAPRE